MDETIRDTPSPDVDSSREPDASDAVAAPLREWNKQEAGWYTSDIGGICQEHDGWAFWPNDMTWPVVRCLPTLGAAMAEAERAVRVMGAAT